MTRSKELIDSQLVWSLACGVHGRYLVENLKLVNYDLTSSTYAKTIKQAKQYELSKHICTKLLKLA